ncbi:MAG: DNA repair protein RadA, partial [Candidatus Cloacimonadota bacterium]|nr:DNA repair protein RadA [Candidatus Cloacimonadota bacterium]
MFVCSECGYETITWAGKCPSCKEWNTLKEFKEYKEKSSKEKLGFAKHEKPLSVTKINSSAKSKVKTGIGEFDTVIGGGIVDGMVTLIGGDPGIGKSTLMLQIANILSSKGKKVLYVSGEESKEQIKLRANRLRANSENLFVFCSSDVEIIINEIIKTKPYFIIIDSIQSVGINSINSAAGSVSQLRESSAMFIGLAKQRNIPTFMIGHVTKQGNVAGPKILEHMVDTVLYFEGDMNQIRILRTTKNRFGSTNEIGIFEMYSDGLKEVKNPNEIFVGQSENYVGSSTGCV